DLIGLIRRRNPRSYEVMLKPGDPAAFNGFPYVLVIHVTHGDLAIGLVLGPERCTKISSGAGCSTRGGIATAVALELPEHVAGPGLFALVVDQIAHFKVVGAALEAEALDVIDTVFAIGKVNHQPILALGHYVLLLGTAVKRTAAGLVRTVTDQTALCFIDMLGTALEQLERNVRTILA